MPTDANGQYSLPPGYFATPNTPILTSQHNPIFEDVAQALTDRLPRNGTAPMTGELILSSASPVALLAAVPKTYVDKKGPIYWGGTSTGTANAQAVTTSLASFSLAAGNRLVFIPGFTPTGATTLAVDGGAATSVKKLSPAGVLPLTGGEFIAGQPTDVLYDGTQFVLMNNVRKDGKPTPVTANTAYTASDVGRFLIFTAVTTVTATIPAAPAIGSFLVWNNSGVVQNLAAASGVFSGPGGFNASPLVLQPGEIIEVISDATNWVVAWRYLPEAQLLPPTFLSGLTLSIASTTSVGVAAGSCRNEDASQPVNMALAAALTKTFSNFVAGSGNGGLDTGTISANSWYHIHLIRKDTGDAVDALLSLSATAPTMPAGYTARRRIGAIRTNASSQVTPFFQVGDEFTWSTPVLDQNSNSAAGQSVLTLTVPPGVRVKARLLGFTRTATSNNVSLAITSPDIPVQVTTNPGGTGAVPMPTVATASGSPFWTSGSAQVDVLTNASAQVNISVASNSSTGTVTIQTNGWIDPRGRN